MSGLSTRISGNMTLGATGVPTYLITVKDITVIGNLIFLNDPNNTLGHTFTNCEFQSGLTFPTTTGTGTISFFDCKFSGSSSILVNNLTIFINFTRCTFNGQTITNTLNTANQEGLTFRNCMMLASLKFRKLYKVWIE